MKILIKTVFLLVVLAFISCRKTDTTKPWFTINLPTQADTFLLSDTIIFNATFTDNEELNQYRLEIKNNFTPSSDSLPAWDTIIVNNLSGISETIALEIVVDDSISRGSYNLLVKAVDAKGNESPADTTSILIQ